MQHELDVALLGHPAETEVWAAILGRRGHRVVRLEAADDLEGRGADLVIAVVSSAEASALAAVRGADGPALALLVGEPHPLTGLVRAILQAKRDWETAFDAVVDPVAIVDADGSVRRANLALARELSLPIREVVGRSLADLLGEAQGIDPVARSLTDGMPRTAEVRYAALPGLHLVTTSPLDADAAGGGGVVATFKDISDQREQQERLQQASRLADVGQLAAGVAHEINTPLASIALRAEALLRQADDPGLATQAAFEKFPRYLRAIDAESFRCKKIIGALLDFSRTRPPEVRSTDVNLLCENAADLLGHQMRLKQVRLDLRLEPGLPRLQADEGQLRQVLVALLMNALDASSASGTVRIETAREAEEVWLIVEDEGAGISVENLDKVFTPFFTTKPPGRGTGLGLAVCHGLVTAHGGRIELQSEIGRGTRVSVVLPMTEEAP
ncbi:MAG: ATP-binding protein [Vicinamibacteria bacterium]